MAKNMVAPVSPGPWWTTNPPVVFEEGKGVSTLRGKVTIIDLDERDEVDVPIIVEVKDGR